VSVVLAAIVFIKEYIDISIEMTHRMPKSMCLLYLFGAYVFVYVVSITADCLTATRLNIHRYRLDSTVTP
jgi:hypothetical protein